MNFIDVLICLPIVSVIVLIFKKIIFSKKRKCSACKVKKHCKNCQNG